MSEVIRFRSAASYRITFSDLATEEPKVLGGKIADILTEFPHTTELRVSCDEPQHASAVVFVMLPNDVQPEALDRRADALRARWEAKR